MSQEIAISENKMPTIAELYKNPSIVLQQDQINVLLNQPPPAKWVKLHPYVDGYLYLPIDKVEFLLRRIFKKYRIEILREGTSFNGVYVVVRVWYLDILTNKWEYHDGIGAQQLQTKKGTSPADLANVNNGALAMAFPIAKTVAIKDACDHFGAMFGANLNRKETLTTQPDEKLHQVVKSKTDERVEKLIEKATTKEELESLKPHVTEAVQQSFDLRCKEVI